MLFPEELLRKSTEIFENVDIHFEEDPTLYMPTKHHSIPLKKKAFLGIKI